MKDISGIFSKVFPTEKDGFYSIPDPLPVPSRLKPAPTGFDLPSAPAHFQCEVFSPSTLSSSLKDWGIGDFPILKIISRWRDRGIESITAKSFQPDRFRQYFQKTKNLIHQFRFQSPGTQHNRSFALHCYRVPICKTFMEGSGTGQPYRKSFLSARVAPWTTSISRNVLSSFKISSQLE